MFKLDVISKMEYNKKLGSIEKNSDLIYNCYADGGDIKKIEAQLGIVSESLREVTFMGDFAKKGAGGNQEQSKEARSLIKKL